MFNYDFDAIALFCAVLLLFSNTVVADLVRFTVNVLRFSEV